VSTSRQSIATLATDLQEVLAWGDNAEAANSSLREMLELERATVLQQVATIAAKDAEIAQAENDIEGLEFDKASLQSERDNLRTEITRLLDVAEDDQHTISIQAAEIARLTALLNPKPAFLWGDATRQQFLGGGFTEPFPGMYESAFWPSTVTQEQRSTTPIQRAFVSGTAMPKWRAAYPNAPYWFGDLELYHSGGFTAAEIAKMLPGFQGARDFADNEGKGLQLAAYLIPRRFGVSANGTFDEAAVMAQIEICRPILNLFDYCLLSLYPIYTSLERSRAYIRANIAMARKAMPGKKVIVLGASGWHSNAQDPNTGLPVPGSPITREWQRMFLEEVHANADGYAPWLMAAEPKPTTEPWWLETLAWKAGL
jgi:hypothetical protein